ncbi:MAG: site-specific integrase [Firmicutes bacterium]|nr:site-specific integrase [Bacillota bacterium]
MGRRGRGEGSIFRRKDGRWAAEMSLGYGPDGKRRRVTIYGKTKREVQEKLMQLQQDALRGLPVKPEKLTVAQHFEDWLAAKRRAVRSGTYLTYESHVRTHIIPAIGAVQLRDLDYRRINALYAKLQETGLAPSTLSDIASVLRSGLDDAVAKGLIPRNPAKMVPKPKVRRHEARFMTQEEVRWLLEAVKGERLEAGFILALYTGMRPGEWLGLPWDAVDLTMGTVTVRQALHEENGRVFIGPVKTKAALRTITIPQTVVQALREHQRRQRLERMAAGPAWQDSGLVFTNTLGGLLRRSNVSVRDLARVIRKARKLAAEAYEKASMPRSEAQAKAAKLLEGVTLHTFRHTHAAALIAAGVDILTVSRRLGHENVRITLELYGHLMPGQDEKAAAAIERFAADISR